MTVTVCFVVKLAPQFIFVDFYHSSHFFSIVKCLNKERILQVYLLLYAHGP